MKKRLLWMIDSLGPGGAENLMPTILGNINKDKFTQRVCVLQIRQGNPIGEKIKKMGFPVDFVPVPNLRNPKNIPRILNYLRQHNPNIVHTQLEFSNTLGNLAAKILKIPSVSTLHTQDKTPRNDRAYWRHLLMWASLRHCADRVISVSNSARKQQIQEGKLSPSQIITIYNGINLSPFSPENHLYSQELKAQLNIPPEGFVIISVAVLREAKGIQYMLKALPAIISKMPNTYYLVVGDGEYMQTLQQQAKSLKIEKYIRFAGFRNDIAELLAMSNLFAHPTLTDALPTVLIEAMAAQKPLVASAVGGVPEILHDEINGFLVPPANVDKLTDACLFLMKNQAQATRMAAAGSIIAQEKFSISKQVQNLETLYEELISTYEK